MQLSLFDQVDDLLHALVPDELGRLGAALVTGGELAAPTSREVFAVPSA